MPRVAGRHHAIEHVDAALDGENDVFRRADTHQVAGFVFRQTVAHVVENALHVFLRLTDRQAAQRIAVEADFAQLFQRAFAQVFVHAALDDGEQGIRVAFMSIFRTFRPTQRQLHRDPGSIVIGRIRRALVEDHHDVRIQRLLDFHALFRRQHQTLAVDRRRELDAHFADLAQMRQAPDLKAAGIGQNRAVPAHEAMQPAVRGDDLLPRAQPEMKGVAENDLGAEIDQFMRRHALDRADRADRHEYRSLDHAMRGFENAAPGLAGLMGNLKLHMESVNQNA